MSTLAQLQEPSALGTLAAPITLGATGSGTDVYVFTHNFNKKASLAIPVESATGSWLATITDVVVTQNANAITVTNGAAAARSMIVHLRWEDASVQINNPVPASGASADARGVYS